MKVCVIDAGDIVIQDEPVKDLILSLNRNREWLLFHVCCDTFSLYLTTNSVTVDLTRVARDVMMITVIFSLVLHPF